MLETAGYAPADPLKASKSHASNEMRRVPIRRTEFVGRATVTTWGMLVGCRSEHDAKPTYHRRFGGLMKRLKHNETDKERE